MTTLNPQAVEHVRSLIREGKIDRTSDWSFSEADEGAVLGSNNWTAYSRVHLGIDPDEPKNSKARYSLPVVKAGVVYGEALKEALPLSAGLLKMAGIEQDKKHGNDSGKQHRSARTLTHPGRQGQQE